MAAVDESLLRSRFEAVEAALDAFQGWWKTRRVAAQVYDVELLEQPISPTAVAVETLEGRAAIDAARTAYE